LKDVIENIKTSAAFVSSRKMKYQMKIKFLIDYARYAPSGFNIQPWSFLVIKNKDSLFEAIRKRKESDDLYT